MKMCLLDFYDLFESRKKNGMWIDVVYAFKNLKSQF